MRRVVRVLSVLVPLIAVLATHPVSLSGACSAGIVTSPQGLYDAKEPSTSGDGRYTVFYTQSPLIPADTNNHVDVYVVDRLTCALEVVSVSTTGAQGNNPSTYATISADGQMVAFMSTASSLVANDTNVGVDVFVRNRAAGTTIRASVKSNGAQAVAGSDRPRISSDGQVVTFRSNANDLVPGNVTGVFVRDLAAGTTELISAGGDAPAISADGRYVAFSSIVTTLVPSDTNNASDVFRYDRQTGTTIRVSVQTGGAEGPTGLSNFPSISGDGRFIAFDYLGGPPLIAGGQAIGVYVHDVNTVTTELINVPLAAGPVVATRPSISADGRYVAFAGGMGIAVGDTTSLLDVMVRDRLTGVTRRVSASASGTEGNLSAPSLGIPDISDDGTVVAYQSNSNNLVPNDTNGRDDVFIAEWRLVSMTPDVNLIRNGAFSSGTTTWQPFATPDLSYIDTNVTGGVLQFNRVAPPPNTSNQAVVLQGTTAQLQAGSPLVATFQLGNSSTVRKRISVLLHDEDFSDLSVCTFWLPPATPLQPYTMRTHTTEAWSGATISFYAATAGADGGYNRLDNVTLTYAPTEADDETDCVDPLAPAPSVVAAGPDLMVNGSFSTGLAPWNPIFDITHQVTSGVFEFTRPGTPNTPAGVVLQQTGASTTAGDILTAQFDLGNSSSVRKRVTVLLHDIDFSDLSACTFWIPPGQPPSAYAMRSYATEAWVDATISVYAATVGTETWTQLDNVSLRRTPDGATTGTNCSEPGSAPLPGAVPASASTAAVTADGGFVFLSEVIPGGGSGWRVEASASVPYALALATPIDLRQAASARLRFASRLVARESRARVEVSVDGQTWQDLDAVPPSSDWLQMDVDLTAFAGQVIYVRFVFDAVAPTDGSAPDAWQVMGVVVDRDDDVRRQPRARRRW